jgi:hypothetical protein
MCRVSDQLIPAFFPPPRLDNPGPSQLKQNILKETLGNGLSRCNRSDFYWPFPLAPGQLEYCPQSILSFL